MIEVISFEIAPRWMLLDLTIDVSIGSGNGLAPSGNKPLPEPMLTQIYVAKCLNELTHWGCVTHMRQ